MLRYSILLFLFASNMFSQQNSTTAIAVSDLVGQGVNQTEANVVTEQLRAEFFRFIDLIRSKRNIFP